jgi:hypothetical protein
MDSQPTMPTRMSRWYPRCRSLSGISPPKAKNKRSKTQGMPITLARITSLAVPSQQISAKRNKLAAAPAIIRNRTGRGLICCDIFMGLTKKLTHAGPEDATREAELTVPSGVVCSDRVGPLRFHALINQYAAVESAQETKNPTTRTVGRQREVRSIRTTRATGRIIEMTTIKG